MKTQQPAPSAGLLGFSPYELAEYTGITPATFYAWIRKRVFALRTTEKGARWISMEDAAAVLKGTRWWRDASLRARDHHLYNLRQAAARLGMSTETLRQWVSKNAGLLQARRIGGALLLRPVDLVQIRRLQTQRRVHAHPDYAGQPSLSVSEAARELGCAPVTIHYWIRTGLLSACRPAGTARYRLPQAVIVAAADRLRMLRHNRFCPQEPTAALRTALGQPRPPHTSPARPAVAS